AKASGCQPASATSPSSDSRTEMSSSTMKITGLASAVTPGIEAALGVRAMAVAYIVIPFAVGAHPVAIPPDSRRGGDYAKVSASGSPPQGGIQRDTQLLLGKRLEQAVHRALGDQLPAKRGVPTGGDENDGNFLATGFQLKV